MVVSCQKLLCYFFSSENRILCSTLCYNEIGDLDAFIKDTEGMIVNELEEDILDCEIELRSTFGALAELESAYSMKLLESCAEYSSIVRSMKSPMVA